MDIGTVIFFKALVLAGWAGYKEVRDARKAKAEGFDPELVSAVKDEWDRRCSRQPRMLTDNRPEFARTGRPVE